MCLDTHANQTKLLVLEAVKNCGLALQYAAEEFRSDKEVVLAAVRENGNALCFARKHKTDNEVVLEAVKQDGQALMHVVRPWYRRSETTYSPSREVVLEAMRTAGGLLAHVNPRFYTDKEVVLAAVKSEWRAARMLMANPSNILATDVDIVLALVKQAGRDLMYDHLADSMQLDFRMPLVKPWMWLSKKQRTVRKVKFAIWLDIFLWWWRKQVAKTKECARIVAADDGEVEDPLDADPAELTLPPPKRARLEE